PASVLVTKDELLSAGNRPAALTVPSRELIPDTDQLAEEIALPFSGQEISALRLFRELRLALAQGDLTRTPIARLFDIDVPFMLPEEARFSGHWILSPPGRGKTTLLHAMVMEDVRQPQASLILMDSKGDLIDPIRKLKSLQDRLLIIDPDPQ